MTADALRVHRAKHRGRGWVILLGLLLAACIQAPAGTSGPAPTPTSQPWQPPGAPIGLDNVPQIALLGTDRQPRGTTFRMDFSTDGVWMLAVSGDGAARLWDLMQGQPVWTHDNPPVSAAYFAANDRELVLIGNANRQVDVYDAADRALLRTFSGATAQVGPSAVGPAGDRLVLGTQDGHAVVWDLASGDSEMTYVLEAANMPVQGLALSPDGGTLATYSPERVVRLWNLTSGATQAILADFDQPVRVVAFSADGAQVAIGFQAQVRVWAAQDGAPLRTLNTANHAADRQVLFTPDGYLLGGGAGSDAVSMWALDTGELYASLPGHGQGFNSMALSPNGELLVTVAQPGPAYLWNMRDPNQRVELAGTDQQITLAGWSPDGRLLVLAAADGGLAFWGIPSGPEPTSGQG